MNRRATACPHCLEQVSNLGRHVRDTGAADTPRDDACPVLFMLRNPNLAGAAT